MPADPLIFHITHVDNLVSIVADGCLWCDSQRIARRLVTTNIGYAHIKQRRLNRAVTAGAGGRLGDYVPFNFCSRAVMLYVVHRGHQDYVGGQDEIVHLVSSVSTAVAAGRPWVFTDRHADLAYARYFASLADLGEVDWGVMPLTHWGGNDDLKERRQAEFLVHYNFPWAAVLGIGVRSAAMAARVQALLRSATPPVAILPDWYY